MSLIMILNQPQISTGLVTYTHTVAATGNYNVNAQVSVPSAAPTGDGAGSGTGLGSGTGGGAQGFVLGDQGAGHGGVGQGFGAGNNYQQPPAYGSNESVGSAVSSGLSIVVNNNGSPVYTAPAFGPFQEAIQFKFPLQATAADVITVVLSSSTASDKQLAGVQSVVTIGQGF